MKAFHSILFNFFKKIYILFMDLFEDLLFMDQIESLASAIDPFTGKRRLWT